MLPPWLTVRNIRYISRVKWSNPGKGVAPTPTPRCSSYWKGSLLVTLDYGRQLYFFCRHPVALVSRYCYLIWILLDSFNYFLYPGSIHHKVNRSGILSIVHWISGGLFVSLSLLSGPVFRSFRKKEKKKRNKQINKQSIKKRLNE